MIKKIDKELPQVEKLILEYLSTVKEPKTTYEIAKALGISWATVSLHCTRLRAMGLIKSEEKISKTGAKKIVWWV